MISCLNPNLVFYLSIYFPATEWIIIEYLGVIHFIFKPLTRLLSTDMGKAVVITPIYLSFAWALMITYQLYTEIAVKTVMGEIMVLWPQLGNVLSTSVDLLVFVLAFSWVFMLSSVIPSLILGKDGSTLVQFFVVLALTSSTLIIQDIVVMYTGMDVNRIFSLTEFLMNPFDAATYLVLPYIVMFMVDLFSKKHL